MSLNLDQVKTLDAIAKLGSVASAAEFLHKVPSAVIYTMKSIEDQIEFKVFDRTGYRTKLTAEGMRIWQESQKYIEAEQDLEELLKNLKGGWEAYLKLVFDGGLPLQPILKSLKKLEQQKISTKLFIYSEYLSRVEEFFYRERADLMLSVLPPESKQLDCEKLASLKLHLVCHESHTLAEKRKVHSLKELQKFLFITVRGSDLRLQLSTVKLDESSQLHMSDFYSKKEAIMAQMGYGWLPEFLIEKELLKKSLVSVRWEGKSEQTIPIFLSHRGKNKLGKTGQFLVNEFLNQNW